MTYQAEIRRIEMVAVFDIQGKSGDIEKWVGEALPRFPAEANTRVEAGEIEIYWVGRNRWLLRGPIEVEEDLEKMLRSKAAPPEVSIALVSDAYTFFEIFGPDAHEILSVATSLDFLSLPDKAAGYTEAFGQRALLVKRNGRYELAIDSSYATMMEDFLARVAGRTAAFA